jgi:hypothetical protein
LRKTLIAVALLVLGVPSRDRVTDMGYCPDVASPACPVRAYWPNMAGNGTGYDAYWLAGTQGRVCFVTRSMYNVAVIGQDFECLWREQPSPNHYGR